MSQRQTRRANRLNKQVASEDEPNQNDNHCVEAQTSRKRNVSGASTSTVKSKVCKVNTMDQRKIRRDRSEDQTSEEELDDDDTDVQKVNFTEGVNEVDFGVHTDEEDFENVEDDPESSDEEDLEEGEVGKESEVESEAEVGESEPEGKDTHRPKANKGQKKARRESLEAKLDSVTASLNILHQAMKRKGFFDDEQPIEKPKKQKGNKKSEKKRGKTELMGNSVSETTIYQPAILAETNENHNLVDDKSSIDEEITFKMPNEVNNRASTSSEEEQINTSDELADLDVEQFIADCQEDARRRSNELNAGLPSPHMNPVEHRDKHERTETQGRQATRQAEAGHARMVAMAGNPPFTSPGQLLDRAPIMGDTTRQQANIVDESYMVVGTHVDETLKRKIINHEYVDFARLLSRDRVSREEDNQMELVSRGGTTYFVPVSDRELNGSISNFSRWEQAFRAFSNIYNSAYPSRSTELVQYNHLIYTASLSFIWDNVYHYDKEFRLHMSNFPGRNWGVILQQAWSVYLKDRIPMKSPDNRGNNGAGKKKEVCKRFNRGLCTSRYRCSFEHRCLNCGKLGHRAHICRQKKQNSNGKPDQPEAGPSGHPKQVK